MGALLSTQWKHHMVTQLLHHSYLSNYSVMHFGKLDALIGKSVKVILFYSNWFCGHEIYSYSGKYSIFCKIQDIP